MKKTLILTLVMLASMGAFAQGNKPVRENRAYVAFTGGMAFPVGEFASSSFENGGFAKSGFNLNIQGGYSFPNRWGLGGNLFYSTYGINTGKIEEILGVSGLNMDHWQYYGLTVGPYFSLVKSRKIELNLKLYGGASRANSPVTSYESQRTNEVWATAFTLQGGGDFRYWVSPKAFLMASLDYTSMKPKFNDAGTDYTQQIDAIHFGIGVGFHF
jgi:hypothetical protein